MPVAIALGVFCGIGVLVLDASRAFSYLSDRPEVCVNCHIMVPEYTAWHHGSHTEAATCADCHLPHESVARKYAGKAVLGARHAWVFTWRAEPQAIRAHALSVNFIQDNCIRCHAELNDSSFVIEHPKGMSWHEAGTVCWRCHRDVGHGRVSSLAATANALAPRRARRVPEWLAALIAKEADRDR
jgi:cytochrome c nitrite reductase small subunit